MLIAKVKDNIVKEDLTVKKSDSIFKRKICSLESLKTKKNFSKIEINNFDMNVKDDNNEKRLISILEKKDFELKKITEKYGQ